MSVFILLTTEYKHIIICDLARTWVNVHVFHLFCINCMRVHERLPSNTFEYKIAFVISVFTPTIILFVNNGRILKLNDPVN
jgi:hypothetical protein